MAQNDNNEDAYPSHGTYADIHTFENLYHAYSKAARGKRGRQPAAGFEFRWPISITPFAT
ncbi:MAG: hypothetical protein AAF702_20870 [Chloroflexota bacterium]